MWPPKCCTPSLRATAMDGWTREETLLIQGALNSFFLDTEYGRVNRWKEAMLPMSMCLQESSPREEEVS